MATPSRAAVLSLYRQIIRSAHGWVDTLSDISMSCVSCSAHLDFCMSVVILITISVPTSYVALATM
jgi:hypothetical protein